MHIVRIEHAVPDFDAWKKAFDSDPVDREQSGVRRHQVLRPIDDPNYALVDLEFDSSSEAEAFLTKLHELWHRVDVMRDPRGRVVETVESKEY